MTRETAIKWLGVIFSNSSGDTTTRDSALLAAGKKTDNKKWFSYITTAMGEYELFTKTYSKDGKLKGLVLTEKGKRALGRDEDHSSNSSLFPENSSYSTEQTITPEKVYSYVRLLAKQNPSFNVKLVFEPKETPIGQR